MMSIFHVSLGVLLALAVALAVTYLYVRDITQKKHAILRNFPIVGRLRYFFEQLGEYFRQYFFLGDRDERPFDRATRSWVYRLAKDEGGVIGFGSTYDLQAPGALVFVNAPFPVLEEERLPTPPLAIGEGWCARPFPARSLVNVSGMSFGALSRPAVQALSRGAAAAGCWMDTGEGGLAPYHLEGGYNWLKTPWKPRLALEYSAGSGDSATTLQATRERNGAHAFITDEFCTDIPAAADDLEQTLGQTRGFESIRKEETGIRRPLGGLENDRAPRGKRVGNFMRGECGGRIPRHDGNRHTERLAQNFHIAMRTWHFVDSVSTAEHACGCFERQPHNRVDETRGAENNARVIRLNRGDHGSESH